MIDSSYTEEFIISFDSSVYTSSLLLLPLIFRTWYKLNNSKILEKKEVLLKIV